MLKFAETKKALFTLKPKKWHLCDFNIYLIDVLLKSLFCTFFKFQGEMGSGSSRVLGVLGFYCGGSRVMGLGFDAL